MGLGKDPHGLHSAFARGNEIIYSKWFGVKNDVKRYKLSFQQGKYDLSSPTTDAVLKCSRNLKSNIISSLNLIIQASNEQAEWNLVGCIVTQLQNNPAYQNYSSQASTMHASRLHQTEHLRTRIMENQEATFEAKFLAR